MLDEGGFGEDDRPDPPLPAVVDNDMRWLIWLAAGVISLVAVVLVLIAVLR